MWNGQMPALDMSTSIREKAERAADTIWEVSVLVRPGDAV